MSASLYFNGFDPNINLSNNNAADFMRSIGINYDFANCEELPIAILEEKIIQFISNHGPASPLHSEIPAKQIGNFIECGRRENYLIEKAWQIISALRDAKREGKENFFWC